MIYPSNNQTQTKWERGEFKVQLRLPHVDRPVGFCDGTEADVTELRERSVSEGAEEFRIQRKQLKTGREIWTLG